MYQNLRIGTLLLRVLLDAVSIGKEGLRKADATVGT